MVQHHFATKAGLIKAVDDYVLALVLTAISRPLPVPPVDSVATVGGWLPQKLAAYLDVARAFPRLLRERRAIQAGRRIDAATFADAVLTPDLDSEYLGRASHSRLLRALLRAYWRAARSLI